MESQGAPSGDVSGPSPLLKLPLKIRQDILRYLVVLPLAIPNPWKFGSFQGGPNRYCIEDLDARIILTCRSLYHETSDILYGENIFTFTSASHLRECVNQIKQNLSLVKHVCIKIGPEQEGEKWQAYLLQHGEGMLRQASRLTRVDIILMGNKPRFEDSECYGKVDQELVKAIKLIADVAPSTTLAGVCFEKNAGLQEELPTVQLLPANETIEGSACTGCWGFVSNWVLEKFMR